ncbi:MAG: ABC transporter permease [Chlamydiae bacterium]|nr:ABC transporter permease [Chlamydiota bacterium]
MNPENYQLALELLPKEFLNTLYMVFTSTFFALVLGLPLGILLSLTDKGQCRENIPLYKFLETIVNIGRSFPFAILMIAIIPFTRWLVGTSLGTTASIVPLSLAAAPFVARVVESSLKDVDRHTIEASLVMGVNLPQLIFKVLLPESFSSLLSGITLTMINLVGYSAMAGLIGGGGLGKIAIQYGYQRFNPFLMSATVILLIILVQVMQWVGNSLVKKIDKTHGKIK